MRAKLQITKKIYGLQISRFGSFNLVCTMIIQHTVTTNVYKNLDSKSMSSSCKRSTINNYFWVLCSRASSFTVLAK